jgi:hypothetical protein
MPLDAIAAAYMERCMAQTAVTIEQAMMKRAMDLEQALAAQLLDSLKAAVPTPPPAFGHRLDVLT